LTVEIIEAIVKNSSNGRPGFCNFGCRTSTSLKSFPCNNAAQVAERSPRPADSFSINFSGLTDWRIDGRK
jgi:hypothetical protein